MPNTLTFYQCGRCGHYHEPAEDRPSACEHSPWRADWLFEAFPGWREVADPDTWDDDNAYPAFREAQDDARQGR